MLDSCWKVTQSTVYNFTWQPHKTINYAKKFVDGRLYVQIRAGRKYLYYSIILAVKYIGVEREGQRRKKKR